MAAPHPLVSSCDVYRPFGAASPVHTNVPCRLVPSERIGRGDVTGPTYLTWTHWLDLDGHYDLRDGCSRAAGTDYVTFADGDEVRVLVGGRVWTFVVVWTEWRYPDEPTKEYTRAYLLRDSVSGW